MRRNINFWCDTGGRYFVEGGKIAGYRNSLTGRVFQSEQWFKQCLHILAQCFVFVLYCPAPDNSPRIGASRVAQVVIEKNDNASGIVQLSNSAVSVHEPHSGSVVNVTRTAGDFGTVSEVKLVKMRRHELVP